MYDSGGVPGHQDRGYWLWEQQYFSNAVGGRTLAVSNADSANGKIADRAKPNHAIDENCINNPAVKNPAIDPTVMSCKRH